MSAARDRLLQAAGQLFGERGYECVGINEVIAKADIAKATFYQHFPSKESLCNEWLRGLAEVNAEDQEQLLREDLPVRDKVAKWFDRFAQCGSSTLGCPFSITASMVSSSSETAAAIRENRTRDRAFWHSLALETELKPGPARDLGDAWMLLLVGASTEARNLRNNWPFTAARKAALEICPAVSK